MSSLPRRMARKVSRKSAEHQASPELYREANRPNSEGYEVCHRTKGYRRFSAYRLRAGYRLNGILNSLARRLGG
jgi:hypothetical protein